MKKSVSIDRPCATMTGLTSHQLCFLEPFFRLTTQGRIIIMLELMLLIIACLHNILNVVRHAALNLNSTCLEMNGFIGSCFKQSRDEHADKHADELSDSPQDFRINTILKNSSESYADRVGFMGIIDLTSENIISMLKDANEYANIMKASSLNDATLTNYAQEILDAFRNTAPSAKSIRAVLREYGNPVDFDVFEHGDFGFIETTTRHFLDLIESPKKPLLGSLQERTTAIYTTTLLLNQLFLLYNDVLELNWIEKEHCTTKKRKWDDVLVLAKDRRVSLSLVEFSGGIKTNNNNYKEKQDISKLYKNMAKILENLPEGLKKQVFAVRFFNENIYFEKLLYHENMYLRCQHSCIKCPTTPRSLLDFTQEVPILMRWRDAVVNYSLQFK